MRLILSSRGNAGHIRSAVKRVTPNPSPFLHYDIAPQKTLIRIKRPPLPGDDRAILSYFPKPRLRVTAEIVSETSLGDFRLMAFAHTGLFSTAYIVSGLVVGVLVGLTGVGGGSLTTPLLVLLFGFHPSTAVGTDLLFASVTKTVGSSVHNAGHSVDWGIVGLLAMGSMPATMLTLMAIAHFGTTSHVVTATISLVLGVALLVSAVSLIVKDWVLGLAIRRNPDFGLHQSRGLTILVGFVVGIVVSISSVGAGALGTIALLYLYPRLPVVRIVGSDIAHAVPLTLIAGIGHWYLGSVNFPLLASLLIGSIPGIIIGSLCARHAPEAYLKPVLSLLLLIVGIKMLTG